ncbi:hypothetical protein [Bacillus sp. IBL03825]|uniref:hypothetical protein n=1 Tax=Bacillus sp. IBL03825 TaxID=2953580 RepID=UPI002158371A|nr:hypothetical protein [Bacillus sp. IBL03825]MCR6850476.1 hypothetical protein [Bacillus sp. IBL03825]
MVSEILQSGEKVEYLYTVSFGVNPVIVENICSNDETILATKQAEIQLGNDSYLADQKD